MTIMQRPDKIPAGPTDGRFFAVCAIGGFDIQAYPKFKHLVIRLLLVKVNRWYGSAFEIQCGIKDGSINLNYFDLFFMNYFYKKITSNLKYYLNLGRKLVTPWQLIDKLCADFVTSKKWAELDSRFPAAYKRKKYNTNKKSM